VHEPNAAFRIEPSWRQISESSRLQAAYDAESALLQNAATQAPQPQRHTLVRPAVHWTQQQQRGRQKMYKGVTEQHARGAENDKDTDNYIGDIRTG
jgi:hypothetical protein